MEKKTAKPRNTFVDGLIAQMTLEQKVGATMTLSFSGVIPGQDIHDYVTKYHCGGLRLTPIFKAGTTIQYIDPKSGEARAKRSSVAKGPVFNAADYKASLDSLRKLAKSRPLSLPLHFCMDQEGGESSNFYFINTFPYPMGIRATNDPKMSYLIGRSIAEQCRAIGGNWGHSPTVDISCNPQNPELGYRTYSDNAEDVALYAIEACKGFRDGGMIATAKHFPGRGDSAVDAHYDIPVIDVDRETLWNRELLPYRKLIEQDLIPSIMIAHTIYPALDPNDVATVSKPIITGLLREEMGFDGVITTDSMTMGGIVKRYGVAEACAMALEAGADLVLMKAQNHLVEDTFNAIRSFVESGRISMEELDKKLYRILNLKYEYGLFHDYAQDDVDPMAVVNSSKHTQLSLDAAKRSTIVARDKDNVLPLKRDEKVLIVEQADFYYNMPKWHSGILFENCLNYSSNVSYLETENSWTDEDFENVRGAIGSYDKIVITNNYNRGLPSNLEKIIDIIKGTDKDIIVVCSNPYEEVGVPHNAKSVIVNFGFTPYSAEVVAGVLYGKIHAEGTWPVEHHA